MKVHPKHITMGFKYIRCTGPDPGFSVGGGCGPILWGFGLQRGHFLVKMYTKTKELGPVGGACAGHAPPRSAYGVCYTKDTSSDSLMMYLCLCLHLRLISPKNTR